jgi:hypothetical protein
VAAGNLVTASSDASTLGRGPGRRDAGVEGTGVIPRQRKPHEHADGGRERHSYQKSDEAEQIAEGKQRKHDPDRPKSDTAPHEVRREHIIAQGIPDEKDGRHHQDWSPTRPELRNRDAGRDDEAGEHADIGDEAQQASSKSDQDTVLEPEDPQRRPIVDGEHQAKRALAAHEPPDGIVDFAGQRAHGLAISRRDPIVDRRDHPVPLVDQIAGDDRGHYRERKD